MRGDVLVIVDVLSFSTAAVVAVSRGAQLYPCIDEETARQCAAFHSAEIAVRREAVPAHGRFSLSPSSFLNAGAADRIALPSPNGAACCRLGASAPAVLVACLLNASAAARAAAHFAELHQANTTVLACGERWQEPSDEGVLRFALEDYLGAGAVLASITGIHSPEAAVCAAAFRSEQANLLAHLEECASGIELRERGWNQDVEFAARLDVFDTVPVLAGDCLMPYAS